MDLLLKVTSNKRSKRLMYKKERETNSLPMTQVCEAHDRAICFSSSKCKDLRGQTQRN